MRGYVNRAGNPHITTTTTRPTSKIQRQACTSDTLPEPLCQHARERRRRPLEMRAGPAVKAMQRRARPAPPRMIRQNLRRIVSANTMAKLSRKVQGQFKSYHRLIQFAIRLPNAQPLSKNTRHLFFLLHTVASLQYSFYNHIIPQHQGLLIYKKRSGECDGTKNLQHLIRAVS